MFQQCTASGRVTIQLDLADLLVTWRERIAEEKLKLGWQDEKRACHMSVSTLKLGHPPSFQPSMRKEYPDGKIWIESYIKEANGSKEWICM
jgi:hypothetical protein